ncbi:MAG: ABC transporter substrate-binding protein [Ignavibacteriae bacterium]|nr:ABC transporter substrate-binding protein [Ignavibacteriota bacterium]
MFDNMKKANTAFIAILVIILIIASSMIFLQPASARKIGVIVPLTGKSAVWGEAVKESIDLAASGKNIEVVFEDSQCDPKKAVTALTKVIDVDRVSAVIGGFCSSETLAMRR